MSIFELSTQAVETGSFRSLIGSRIIWRSELEQLELNELHAEQMSKHIYTRTHTHTHRDTEIQKTIKSKSEIKKETEEESENREKE